MLFITKCDSFIKNKDSYFKMRRFYYKMPQLLQNASFMSKCVTIHIITGLVCATKSQGKCCQCYFNVSMLKLYFESYVISNMICSTSARPTSVELQFIIFYVYFWSK